LDEAELWFDDGVALRFAAGLERDVDFDREPLLEAGFARLRDELLDPLLELLDPLLDRVEPLDERAFDPPDFDLVAILSSPIENVRVVSRPTRGSRDAIGCRE
jgi:hypothetical protein